MIKKPQSMCHNHNVRASLLENCHHFALEQNINNKYFQKLIHIEFFSSFSCKNKRKTLISNNCLHHYTATSVFPFLFLKTSDKLNRRGPLSEMQQ